MKKIFLGIKFLLLSTLLLSCTDSTQITTKETRVESTSPATTQVNAVLTTPFISPSKSITVSDSAFVQPSPDLSLLTSPTVAVTLGRLPNDCPVGPVGKEISRHFGAAIGGSPVWTVNGDSIFDLGFFLTKNGWAIKTLWVIEPNFKGKVAIHGRNNEDGSPLLFSPQGVARDNQPIQNPVLDAQNPGIPLQHQDAEGYWREWPGYMYAPKAGCYYLEADWSGGNWKINIAIGV